MQPLAKFMDSGVFYKKKVFIKKLERQLKIVELAVKKDDEAIR